jgi:hypothetical protein
MTKRRTIAEAPRVKGLPGPDDIRADRLWLGGSPVIIEGVVDQWPAVGGWSSTALIERCGTVAVEPFATNAQLNGTVLQQINRSEPMTFGEFIRHTFGEARRDPKAAYYLRTGPGSPVYDALAEDIIVPDISRPFNPKWTGLWMGQAGNTTPFHHDWWHGLLAQISGHKRYTLVHPCDGVALQKDWSAGARYDLCSAEVLPADADVLQDLELVFEGVLAPGEMLYVPPYWFHQVVTLDDGNISMPTRFDTTQMPDVSLFQLSQDSCLRPLTNQPVTDLHRVAEILRQNRRRFNQREDEFISALCNIRGLDHAQLKRALGEMPEGRNVEVMA